MNRPMSVVYIHRLQQKVEKHNLFIVHSSFIIYLSCMPLLHVTNDNESYEPTSFPILSVCLCVCVLPCERPFRLQVVQSAALTTRTSTVNNFFLPVHHTVFPVHLPPKSLKRHIFNLYLLKYVIYKQHFVNFFYILFNTL